MRNIFVFALVAFVTVSAAPSSSDTDKIQIIDDVQVELSRLSSGTVNENVFKEAIAKMKQSLANAGDSDLSITLTDRAEKLLNRHIRAVPADGTEDVPVPTRRERVLLKVEKKIADLKASGNLPAHFKIADNFEIPEHFKLPELEALPEKIRRKLSL